MGSASQDALAAPILPYRIETIGDTAEECRLGFAAGLSIACEGFSCEPGGLSISLQSPNRMSGSISRLLVG